MTVLCVAFILYKLEKNKSGYSKGPTLKVIYSLCLMEFSDHNRVRHGSDVAFKKWPQVVNWTSRYGAKDYLVYLNYTPQRLF